jgi:hypothetical protein
MEVLMGGISDERVISIQLFNGRDEENGID